MSDIRLSPTHSVNPSVGVCFYCGQDDGTVVLPGLLKDDAEAPRRAVWSMEPCPTCKKWMEAGIIFISMRDGEGFKMESAQQSWRSRNMHLPESQRTPFIPDVYRTGGFCVLREEAVRRLVGPPDLLDHILRCRWTFMEDSAWHGLGLPPLQTLEQGGAPSSSPA